MPLSIPTPMQVRCPTCAKPFDFEESPAKPFCSERCRLIDLGAWLSEKHSVPVTRKDEDEDGAHLDEVSED